MKVILNQDVKGQGKKGQLVEVSDGYARNFLLPRKLAVEANADNVNKMKLEEKAKKAREAAEKAEAEAIAIQKITEAVGQSTNPANYLLAQKYIAMMQELASGDKSKTVYLPYEATNLLGSIGGIKDLFKTE